MFSCVYRLLAILSLVLLVSSGWCEPGITDKEIVIGSCTDMGSSTGGRGKGLIEGAQAYFDYVNAKGGIHGRRIKLVVYDDLYDPERTIQCLKRLMDEGLFAAGFFVGSASAANAIPMAESHKLPIIGFVTGSEFIVDPVKHYVFNFRSTIPDAMLEVADKLWNELHFRKVGVIFQEDAFGAAMLRGAKFAFAKYGASVAPVAAIPRGSLAVHDAVASLAAERPDVVVLGTVGPAIAEIVKEARALNWSPLFLALTADPAVNKVEGLVVVQVVPSYNDTNLPAVAFYRRLLKKYPELQPSYAGLEGFILARLVEEGIERAGREIDREKYIAALESIRDFDIGLGPDVRVNFNISNHKGTDKVFFTVMRGGKPISFTDWKKMWLEDRKP